MHARIFRTGLSLAVALTLLLPAHEVSAHEARGQGCQGSGSIYWYYNTLAQLTHTSSTVSWNAHVYTREGCWSGAMFNAYPLGFMRVTGTLQYKSTYSSAVWVNCVNGTWGYNAQYMYWAYMPWKSTSIYPLTPCGPGNYRDRLIVQTKSGTTWTTRATLYGPVHVF